MLAPGAEGLPSRFFFGLLYSEIIKIFGEKSILAAIG